MVFWLTGLLVAAGVTAHMAWMLYTFGGRTLTTTVDDYGELVAAALAAAACAWAAAGTTGRIRRGWVLLALATGAWALGQTAWSYYEVILGRQTPFPSLADAGFLAAVPFEVAAVLQFTRGNGTASRAKTVFDGAIVAASMIFISWVVVLSAVYRAGGDGPFNFGLSLAYPVGDIVTIVIVLAALSGARVVYEPMILIAAGLIALTLSDSAFTYLTSLNAFNTNPVDSGWVAGFLLMALAAVSARLRPSSPGEANRLPSRLRSAIPYVPMALAVGLAVFLVVLGRRLDPFGTAMLVLVIVLVLVRQVFALNEVAMLSRQLEETVARLQERERELSFQAFHDPLTALANRALFRDRLEHGLETGRRSGPGLAVLYLDLDQFKLVNDTFGHDTGDRLLVAVAGRLRACVRPGDTVARLGGDEFAILLGEIRGLDDVLPVATRVVDSFGETFQIDKEVTMGVSVGVVLSDAGRVSAEDLLRHVDAAMYTAKAQGRNRFVVYEAGMRPPLSS